MWCTQTRNVAISDFVVARGAAQETVPSPTHSLCCNPLKRNPGSATDIGFRLIWRLKERKTPPHIPSLPSHPKAFSKKKKFSWLTLLSCHDPGLLFTLQNLQRIWIPCWSTVILKAEQQCSGLFVTVTTACGSRQLNLCSRQRVSLCYGTSLCNIPVPKKTGQL